MTTPNIFVYQAGQWGPTDWIAVALAEDGTALSSHVSSSPEWSRSDMGVTSERDGHPKHKVYREHYPDGYNLVWLETDQLEDHPSFQKARKNNQDQAQDDVDD